MSYSEVKYTHCHIETGSEKNNESFSENEVQTVALPCRETEEKISVTTHVHTVALTYIETGCNKENMSCTPWLYPVTNWELKRRNMSYSDITYPHCGLTVLTKRN